MPAPIDQLVPPDECDVPIYNDLRDEFLSGAFQSWLELPSHVIMTADEFRAAMGFDTHKCSPTCAPHLMQYCSPECEEAAEGKPEPKVTPERTKSATRRVCAGATSGELCGNTTFTLVDGKPLCKLHRGDIR